MWEIAKQCPKYIYYILLYAHTVCTMRVGIHRGTTDMVIDCIPRYIYIYITRTLTSHCPIVDRTYFMAAQTLYLSVIRAYYMQHAC